MSDYGPRVDPDRKVTRPDLTVDGLGEQVAQLQRSIDELESEDLPGKVKYLEDELGEDAEAISCLRQELEDHGSEVTAGTRRVKELFVRVAWLERHLRQAPGAQSVDFDREAADLHSTAMTVQHGLAAESAVLSDHQRTILTNTRTSYSMAITARDRAHQRVVALCETLASTLLQQPEHQAAAITLAAAVSAASVSTQRLPQLAAQAAEAEQKLEDDDADRQERAATIEAGRKAHRRLRWELRRRLDEALVSEAMLPTWYITVLGPIPPARNTQQWMEAATEVLAYRITYKVTDPVVALGDEPAHDPQHPERFRWYREIQGKLRGWDR